MNTDRTTMNTELTTTNTNFTTTNRELATIETADLDDVTGGRAGLVRKGAQLAGRGARWAWDNVVKPGAAWAGFDWAVDQATGGGKQQQAPAPQQGQ